MGRSAKNPVEALATDQPEQGAGNREIAGNRKAYSTLVPCERG